METYVFGNEIKWISLRPSRLGLWIVKIMVDGDVRHDQVYGPGALVNNLALLADDFRPERMEDVFGQAIEKAREIERETSGIKIENPTSDGDDDHLFLRTDRDEEPRSDETIVPSWLDKALRKAGYRLVSPALYTKDEPTAPTASIRLLASRLAQAGKNVLEDAEALMSTRLNTLTAVGMDILLRVGELVSNDLNRRLNQFDGRLASLDLRLRKLEQLGVELQALIDAARDIVDSTEAQGRQDRDAMRQLKEELIHRAQAALREALLFTSGDAGAVLRTRDGDYVAIKVAPGVNPVDLLQVLRELNRSPVETSTAPADGAQAYTPPTVSANGASDHP